jgi:epoxyqueuosine reductase
LPLDREKIRAFLGKESMVAHESDNFETNFNVTRLSFDLAEWLREKGHESRGLLSNLTYRTEVEGWRLSMPPDLSHRYIAVRSGLGSLGWSGNVGITGYGTAVILGTTVTSAELPPTEPAPEEESFCTKCKLCVASCASGMFDKEREDSVTLGGHTFKYARRNSYLLCDFVCGGFTGLHPSGKWSTWSPGRYRIPDSEGELANSLVRSIGNYMSWRQLGDGPGSYENPTLEGVNLRLTCGNCQLVCWGSEEETRENYRLLSGSGCVLQLEDGSNVVLPPDDAEIAFGRMDPSHRALYE